MLEGSVRSIGFRALLLHLGAVWLYLYHPEAMLSMPQPINYLLVYGLLSRWCSVPFRSSFFHPEDDHLSPSESTNHLSTKSQFRVHQVWKNSMPVLVPYWLALPGGER